VRRRLEPGKTDVRRNHPTRSEAPPFWWAQDDYGATATGPVSRRLFVPGQGSIDPSVQLWHREGGAWRQISRLDPRDEGHARRCLALMEKDIMGRFFDHLNKDRGRRDA
jgi:hypothetical protein